ncbi:hypothetical protein GSI_11167 [Ganoderma sinense ZZ0214-1]|uniref:Uncharacterized protein n=1 Tax=Ganoderma sinense ZZ0214-1 TaxID=1077348 RepID=A0A2G8RZ06_9APHY|nr:hypothetical protein GSI_11167 [Ganoderma sinense ZZ0214-1]
MTKFILDAYSLCYGSMRRRTLTHEFKIWGLLSTSPLGERTPPQKPVKTQEPLTSQLDRLVGLVQKFTEFVSARETLGDDDDTLRFHELCLALYDTLDGEQVKEFIGRYIHPQGVLRLLAHLGLPKALSTLLSDPSKHPGLLSLPASGQCQWSVTVLDPSRGARQFSTTVTAAHMAERLGDVHVPGPGKISWEDAMEAYSGLVVKTGDFGTGLEWDAARSLLSTPGAVTAHPETTLVQHLVERARGDARGETVTYYIACSRLPCYASVRYVDAVNKVVKPTSRFTMCTTNPDWCRLDVAEPWILPEATSAAVVATLKAEMLWDLAALLH